ncbi:MAG: thioredoxin family protein [Acidobacteriota bacterium]
MTSMKICLTLLLATLFAAVAAAPAQAAPDLEGWHQDVFAAVEEAREKDAMILVDLYADWCGWCKTLEEKVFSHEKFKKYAGDKKFVLLRVDTEDGGQGTMLQTRYRAHSLPTTLILNPKMEKVGAISGFAPVDTFVSYIDQQLNAWQILLANYDLVLKEGEAHLQRDLAKDFHERGAGEKAAALYDSVLSKVQSGTSAEAWLQYLSADAHRIGGNFEEAEARLVAVKKATKKMPEEKDLIEKADLLSFYIAQDAGDCQQAVHSIEVFLSAHPRSLLRRELQKALRDLKAGDSPTCA